MSDDYDVQVSSLTSVFEGLFLQQPPNISDQILASIQSNPGVASAEGLAAATISSATRKPESSESLILVISQVLPSTEGILVNDEDAGYMDASFSSIFLSQLSDFLSNTLHELQLHEAKQVIISPENPVLAAAIFSASLIKQGVSNSKSIYSFTRQGLQLPDATIEEERKEIVAVGACLQLLIAGKIMMANWLTASDGSDSVIDALERLKERKVIKYPNAQKILEITIDEAKTKFANPLPPAEVWSTLFPQ